MEYFAKESRNLQEEIRRREKEHDKSKKVSHTTISRSVVC